MRENRPSGSEGGVAFGPSLPLSGPFVNPPWDLASLGSFCLPEGAPTCHHRIVLWRAESRWCLRRTY